MSIHYFIFCYFISDQVLKVSTDNILHANPDILDGVDDLMQLSYLNEPAVLYNLQYRYSRNMIYVSQVFLNFHQLCYSLFNLLM